MNLTDNMQNPRNVIGMGAILADDDTNLDISDIERSIYSTEIVAKSEPHADLINNYQKEMNLLSEQFNVPRNTHRTSALDVIDEDDDLLDLINGEKSHEREPALFRTYTNNRTDYKSDYKSGHDPNYKTDYRTDYKQEYDRDADAESDTYEYGRYGPSQRHTNTEHSNYQNNRPSQNYGQVRYDDYDDEQPAYDRNDRTTNILDRWDPGNPNDDQLQRLTNEERKQSNINRVISAIEHVDGDDNNFLQQEDEEDEMAKILEQIDLLRTNLENEGVNLTHIQEVSINSSMKEAKSILRILQIKNDRLRYCDMFEEGILAMAYGLESMFDGKKEWFGTKIDLVGWPDTVKVKLRRMRYNTSSFVSGIMKGYSIGHGWRIMFELLPSLFLYSRDRRIHSGDNLISDQGYRDAIHEMHNT